MKRYQIAALLFIFVCLTIACKQDEKSISPPEDLTKLALRFVDSMVVGDFEDATATFTSKMKEALPARELGDTWASINSGNGPLRGLGGVRATESGGYICIFVKCEFELAKLDVKVVFDKKSRISGLWFVKPDPTMSYEPVAQTSVKPMEQPTVTTDRATEIVQLATGFVDLLGKGDFGSAVGSFDKVMAEKLPADELKKAWEKMLSAHGPFIGQLKTRSTKSGEFDIVFVTVEFKKSMLDVKVVFNKNRKVSGLWFE